jgi:DNA-binding PadR family transcriptional regulator
MTKSTDNSLMALLGKKSGGTDTWTALAAKTPVHDPSEAKPPAQDEKLHQLLQRINHLTTSDTKKTAQPETAAPTSAQAESAKAAQHATGDSTPSDEFLPIEPPTIRDAGLTDSEVESLALKFLLSRGDLTGREMADQIRLPFVLIDVILRQLKQDQLLVYRSSAPMNDYVYQLTDLGRERARRYMEHCTYFGSAPVSLMDYILGVTAQSLTKQHPSSEDLGRAFSDILVNPNMLRRLGPAINSGRGLFLYGSAGNGKTTIAERVTRAFGQYIWIPRAIGIDGEIIRLFDPVNHEECPLPQNTGLLDQSRLDRRWVRIRRPTIVVGGELTMDSLEVTLNRSTGISEAPLQLKSNCGTLVIDDFGRQKMSTDQLLNRWIVPLEKRYDYLNLPNGKKIQVPFDQLIVFSTNLEPKQLVDEAFLRRIPYKIEVLNPTEEEFRKLFELMCPKLGFIYDARAIDYLIERHYRSVKRPFRACQPRDLLMQVKNFCMYQKQEATLSPEFLDLAVENYFAVM